MVYNLCIAERSQVCRTSIFTPRADETDWSWDDGRDEQLVVENSRATFSIRVNLDVVLFQALAIVVCAVAELPVGVADLGVVEFVLFWPVWAGAFDGLEVAVGVAFYLLLAVVFVVFHLFRSGVVLVLFFV